MKTSDVFAPTCCFFALRHATAHLTMGQGDVGPEKYAMKTPAEPSSLVLVVDDDGAVRLLLEQLLLSAGYRVVAAPDGREALAAIAAALPDLVLLDLDMPHVGGYEVCQAMKQNPATRWIPIVIITGREEADAKLRAWELGADDFLTKPFQNVEVLARCRSLLRVKRLIDELDSAETVVFAFARTTEAKSRYTAGHAERVADYVLPLAMRLGLAESEQDVLRKGAILHDIGKISIPDAILDKKGPLSDEEYDLIKQHPMQGVRIVEPLHSIRGVIPLIRWHHERLDGRGYPDGLSGDAIPRLVRVLAVADFYDALSSTRPYREALSHDVCLKILQENAAEGGLDADVVRCFCEGTAPLNRVFEC